MLPDRGDQCERGALSCRVPSAFPGGKAAITAARRAQSSDGAGIGVPLTLMTTRPGVGQSLSVATQIGRPPRRGSTLILKFVMLSIQLAEDDDFVTPAKA